MMYKRLALFFYIVLFLFISTSCPKSRVNNYPPAITTAIDYFYTENENEKVLEALDQLTQKDLQQPDNILMRKLLSAAALCELGKTDSAAQILSTINNNNLSEESAFWYRSIEGLILFRQNEFTKAYKALNITINTNFINIKALALNERLLARISFSLSDQQKAIEWLLLSNNHFKQAGLTKSIGVNYKIEGRYYMNNKNYSDALKKFKAAEKIFIKYNDQFELFYVYVNLLDYYLKNNDLETARIYANKCLTQCNEIADYSMKAVVYNNLGEIEMAYNNYEKAIEQFNKTIATPDGYPTSNIRKSYAHFNLSKIYTQLKKNNEAVLNARKAITLLPEKGNTLTKYEIYSLLADNFRNSNQIEAAYSYMDSASMFLDSAYNSVSKTTKVYYETKSDLVNASFDMERLKEKERKQRNIYLTVILGLILLISFTLIIYSQQQSKNRVLKALVKKNLQIIEDERKRNQSIANNKTKKAGRAISTYEKSDLLYSNLHTWLEKDKQFKRKDLNIELIAKELNTNREYLSRSINEQNIRFNDLINKYRVEEAMQIFSDHSNKLNRYNLSVIASEVGFNSNSVFIEAFRKHTGMNPTQFRENANSTEP